MLRLKKILENRGVQFREYASLLGMTEKTLYNKLTCATDFSYGEYKKLKTLLPEYNIDYLLTEEDRGGRPGM